MSEFLHHAASIVLAIPTWLAPLIFLPIAARQVQPNGSGQLWKVFAITLGGFALLATLGWFLFPDNASTPLASVVGEVVLVGPAMATVAVVLQETRASTLPPRNRMMIAGVFGMGALLLCFMPAALVASLLGGGQIGGGC
jgi:hypothetical protein